ncbi:nucleoside diphosphate kinase regulator [Agrobacterium tumefaciens]|uniref:Nucleoside diphosphate kinase regulator n=1 Tax=Agrobacterium tumefaciens TaxID=358 RepID=A0A176XID6_AGRTU|nr:nucleoside diphosphate kinase regulator [Agrobacterium tumefaciens]OAE48915.1 nucleoside diphosphate kinase regulator [Agrobacterium tumefaciens]
MNIPDCGKPSILVRRTDYARLTALALAAPGRDLDAAEELLIELERANVVEDDRFPADAVGIGSTVSYLTEDGGRRTVTLCYPGLADIEHSMVSVLTLIGAALLGLSPGQKIAWTGRDGHSHMLTVLEVTARNSSTAPAQALSK